MTSPPPDGEPHGEIVPLPETHGRSPWPVVGVVALALLLIGGVVAVGVAGSGSPSAAPSNITATGTGASGIPSPNGTPTASPSPSPSEAAPTGPRYHADIDLCGKFPTAPLGNWVARNLKNLYTPAKRDTGVPNSYAVECSITAESISPIFWVELELRAEIYGTTSAASAAYRASLANAIEPDQNLKGYGEVAYGRYGTKDDSASSYSKTSGYQIVLQKENLVLAVGVDLIHDDDVSFIPRQTLLARVGPETKAILSVVPRS